MKRQKALSETTSTSTFTGFGRGALGASGSGLRSPASAAARAFIAASPKSARMKNTITAAMVAKTKPSARMAPCALIIVSPRSGRCTDLRTSWCVTASRKYARVSSMMNPTIHPARLKLTYHMVNAKARAFLEDARCTAVWSTGPDVAKANAKARSAATARVGSGATDIPRRVRAASENDTMSIVRAPTESEIGPTRSRNIVVSVEKVAAHQPAFASLIPWSLESQNLSVERNEYTPRYSKKVAAYTSHSSRGERASSRRSSVSVVLGPSSEGSDIAPDGCRTDGGFARESAGGRGS